MGSQEGAQPCPVRRRIETGYAPIKAWVDGVPVEDAARRQLFNIAALPFIHRHVAVMPDVHLGKGATVGSVIATRAAIVPAAVGVDIGCGMMAVRTTLTAGDLPDSLAKLRLGIEAAVPHGGIGLKGGWKDGVPNAVGAPLRRERAGRRPEGARGQASRRSASAQSVTHLGSLGGGNHFIEVCLDEEERVWAMLHSGSRGIGNRIGTYFIAKAREALDRRQLTRPLPDRDLAWLEEGEPLFEDYVAGGRLGAGLRAPQPRGDDGGRAARHARAAAALPDAAAGHQLPPQLRRARDTTSARTCG